MSTNEQLRDVAQIEFNKHTAESLRIKNVVDQLLDTMEYHNRQAETWNEKLRELTMAKTVERPHLTVVINDD